jgi:diguanylate cyclase (GGDEF)-like protein
MKNNQFTPSEENEPFEHILNSMPGGVCAFRLDLAALVFVNQQFLALFGFENTADVRAYTKGDYWKLIHPDDVENVKAVYTRLSRGAQSHADFECRIVTKIGMIRLVRCRVQTKTDEAGHTLLVNFVMDLGTQNALDMENRVDSMTGLLKMHAFFSAMRHTYKKVEAENAGRQLAVLFFDVINFRQINQRYGIAAGDDFLRAVGTILKIEFPEFTAARFGGDQFAVLADAHDLESRVTHTRDMIRQVAPNSVDCSVGACVWNDVRVDPEEICNRAKFASDENRKHVNTFFSYYTRESGKAFELADYVISHIDEAIKKGWIQVYYQPEIRAISNQICGMEALARWIDPQMGFLSPGEFIGALEDAQLIWKLDLCVIRQVAARIAERKHQGLPGIHISINLSRIDFLCCDIFKEIEALVREYGISRDMLHIEVTESTMTSNVAPIFQAMNRFRDAGYEIWMDDFGSGYSTLNLLKDYAFDVLKLDMAFLRKDTARSRAIITSVIAMDKKIGNMTLAEGVETAEQVEFLKQNGCDCLQGYYFSKPLPFDDALRVCREKGIDVEPISEKSYYDAVQRVNFTTDLPMLLIEYQADGLHVLYINQNAKELVSQDGLETMAALERRLNDPYNAASQGLSRAAQYAMASGAAGELYYPFHGQELLCRYRLISRSDIRYLFAVNVFSYAQTGERLSEKARTLMSLRYFYRALLKIDLDQKSVFNIQFSEDISSDGSRIPIRGQDGTLSSLFPSVFTADQKRYAAFINPDTIKARLQKADGGMLKDAFRTQDDRGQFVWMSHRILRDPNAKGEQIIYAVRTMDIEAAQAEQLLMRGDPYASLIDRDAGVSKGALWDDMMLYFPIPVFWKDKNRRFLGANQAFLDYYGFESRSQILGKTDEDMHWHPNDNPYRRDEMEILATGERHVNMPGKCVAKAVPRSIYATKWPVYRGGEICGLMGYFLDEQMADAMVGIKHSTTAMDPVTGLENVVGLMDSYVRYDADYQLSHRPYGVIFASVTDMPHIAESCGVVAAEDVLRACADVIVKIVGNSGVAARVSASQFAVLYAFKSVDDIRNLSNQIREGIEDIHQVGQTHCTLFAEMHIVYDREMQQFEGGLIQNKLGITAQTSENDEREKRNAVLRELLDPAAVGCYILSPEHKVLYWNPEAEKLLGISAKQMLGKDCFDAHLGCSFTSGIGVPDHRCPAVVALATGKAQSMQMFMRRSDGRDILIRNTLVPLQNADGETDELVALFTPMTDETYDEGMIRDIYEVATRDAVTCLPGRKYIETCLEEELENYQRTGHAFAVLFADADDFHSINNLYGHEVGDEVLRAFGIALRKYGRRTDRFGRWGGDEFVGIMKLKDKSDIKSAAKRFSKIAERIAVQAGDQTVTFHISAGITVVRDGDNPRSIVDRADQYMYLAKSFFKNQVVTDFNVNAIKAKSALDSVDSHASARLKE